MERSPKKEYYSKISHSASTIRVKDYEEYQDASSLINAMLPGTNILETFLSMTEKFRIKAVDLWETKIKPNTEFKNGSYIFHTTKLRDRIELLGDMYENMFMSVIFSVMAADIFANRLIPANYIDSNGNNKNYLEKNIDLESKYIKLIPEIYSILPPTNEIFWKGFLNNLDIRNNILNGWKRNGFGKEPGSISDLFFEFLEHDSLKTTISIIKYYEGELTTQGIFKKDKELLVSSNYPAIIYAEFDSYK